ncbi:Oidioi.mRNA.OKI2018_I69.PAR.g12920.t1.cds [Oikopleura dioica]|uniref:Oidioi.mRNA.OKI2018_I69.PAR.g12920.t1.cds n=1 Tax=Oikopleura dioica TaxID=34765 RepID=A0ABN7S2B2_OIKDI|nr:Oidioi.mRNA.OKI2018_I69.PAR.g12920.t1.cds [Oikopleura dioica]
MNAVFLALVFAVIALLEKISLRNGIILCTSFIFIGSIFKCLVSRRFFWAQIVGQGFVGVANILVTIIPPRVAAVWFAEDELSRSIAALLSAQVIGNALGLLIPNLTIKARLCYIPLRKRRANRIRGIRLDLFEPDLYPM